MTSHDIEILIDFSHIIMTLNMHLDFYSYHHLELMTNAKNEAEIMAKYLMKQLEVLQQQVEGGDVAVPDAKGLDYEIGYVGKEEPNIDYEEGNAGGEVGDDQEHVEVDAAKETSRWQQWQRPQV